MKLPVLKFKKQMVLHPVARGYFFYSLLVLGLTAAVLDNWVVPGLEDSGKLVGYGWREDDLKTNSFMAARNHADPNNPIWRSDSMPVSEQRKKSKRILVIGDSYVWGHGYNNVNTIWWRQLENELERRGYNDVEVIAAGLRGLATWQEVAMAKKLVPIYKPDAVIWGYVTNDPDEIGHVPDKKTFPCAINLPADPVVSKRMENLTRSLFPNLGDQLLALRQHNRDKRLSGARYGYRFADWELEILKGDSFAQYGQTVKELSDFVHLHELPSFVIAFPNGVMCDGKQTDALIKSKAPFLELIREHYKVRYAPVKAVFEKNGVQFLDLIDDFIAYARQHGPTSLEQRFSYGINPDNAHPGPLATHFYAIKAADMLEQQYPQCLGPKSKAVIPMGRARFNDWVPPWIGLWQGPQHTYLSYPPEADLLMMPMRKPFVQLNLERPVALKDIHLEGTGLKGADIYISSEDANTHFDNGALHELGDRKGGSLSWQLPQSSWTANVSTIRISAKLRGDDRGLRLVLNPAAGVVQ